MMNRKFTVAAVAALSALAFSPAAVADKFVEHTVFWPAPPADINGAPASRIPATRVVVNAASRGDAC